MADIISGVVQYGPWGLIAVFMGYLLLQMNSEKKISPVLTTKTAGEQFTRIEMLCQHNYDEIKDLRDRIVDVGRVQERLILLTEEQVRQTMMQSVILQRIENILISRGGRSD